MWIQVFFHFFFVFFLEKTNECLATHFFSEFLEYDCGISIAKGRLALLGI